MGVGLIIRRQKRGIKTATVPFSYSKLLVQLQKVFTYSAKSPLYIIKASFYVLAPVSNGTE